MGTVTITCASSTVAAGMLQRMQGLEELQDVALRVRDDDGDWVMLRAHRIVLAAASDALRAMFVGSFREGVQEVTTLEEVPAWAARLMLDFIYTGKAAVPAESLLQMAQVADFFGLLSFKARCVSQAVQKLKVSNAADMFVAADRMGLQSLRKRVMEVILVDYAKMAQTPGFQRVPCSLLKELIGSDDLRVRREEEVFESVIQWLKGDPDRGHSEASELLPLIRFPRMSPQYLLTRVEVEPELRGCEARDLLLREAKDCILLSLSSARQLPQSLAPQRTRPRIEFGDILIEGPSSGEPQADCVGIYELCDLTINGRPVYQQHGETDLFLYFSSTDKWYISDGEDMRLGRPRGWCQVASQALVPSQITEEWAVWDSISRGWEVAPRIKARQVNDAILGELASRQQVQEARARRHALQVGDVVIEGQAPGELQADRMGMYELQDRVVNGRLVYRQEGGADMYLFYASRGSKWCISDGEDMAAGRPKGWCYVVSHALTPDQITELWEVVADDAAHDAYWQPAPRLRVRPKNRAT